MRSRSEENILKELAVLAGAGYQEVVFSGINLSSYGRTPAPPWPRCAKRPPGAGHPAHPPGQPGAGPDGR